MPLLSVFDQVAMHPFLNDLPTAWLQRLATCAKPNLWYPGRRVFREDAAADHFWLLCSGVVSLDFHVPGRGDVAIERIGEGDVLGWSWLMPPARWTLGAVAVGECRAIEFDARRVRTLMADDGDLGRELTARFVAVLAERLQAARQRLLELYAYPADTPRTP